MKSHVGEKGGVTGSVAATSGGAGLSICWEDDGYTPVLARIVVN